MSTVIVFFAINPIFKNLKKLIWIEDEKGRKRPYFIVNDEKILNQEVILKFTKENVDEVVEKIKLLDSNNNLYLEFKNKNVINEGGIEYVKEKYENLRCKIIQKLI